MASRRQIEAGRAVVTLSLRDRLAAGLTQASRQLKNFGTQISSVGRQLAGFATAVGVPIGLATKIFSTFDDQIRTVAAVTQASDAEMAKLTETAKLLGRTTSFTASQVAELMTELGRAGFTAQQIDEMTGSVLALSRATGTDSAVSAGIAASTIRQFGLAAEDTARVADSLTAASNKSFNTLESLGEALSYAGPTAADANLSLEDTLAILGALGNVGIQGSNAGTAVRRLLTLSASQAEEFNKIFGVATRDAEGNARALVDVLGEIDAATAGLGSADRAAKFNEAFGLLGITAASALSKNTLGVKQLQAEISSASDLATQTAEALDAGIGGAFRKLLSAVEGTAIAIGAAIEKPIRQAADVLAGLSGTITEFISRNERLAIGITKLVGVIGGLGGVLVGVGATLTAIGFAVSPLSVVVVGLTVGVTGLIAAFNGGRIAGLDFGQVILSIANDLGILEKISRKLSAGLDLNDATDRYNKAASDLRDAQKVLDQADSTQSQLAARQNLVAALERQIEALEKLDEAERKAGVDQGEVFNTDNGNNVYLGTRRDVQLFDQRRQLNAAREQLDEFQQQIEDQFKQEPFETQDVPVPIKFSFTSDSEGFFSSAIRSVRSLVSRVSDAARDFQYDLALFGADSQESAILNIERQTQDLKRAARELGLLTPDVERQIEDRARVAIADALEVDVNASDISLTANAIADTRAVQSLQGGAVDFQKRTADATERTAQAVERMERNGTLRYR